MEYQMDYSQGRYTVIDSNNKVFGRIDNDEFVREFSGANLLFRIDGEEFYSMSGELLGFIDSGTATNTKGALLFKIINE